MSSAVLVWMLPALLALWERSLPVSAAPSPRQKAPIQFRCEVGDVWMENCNECRCEHDNHVVCAHLACLQGRLGPLLDAQMVEEAETDAEQAALADPQMVELEEAEEEAAEAAGALCYRGACPAECAGRVDSGGCRVCDCSDAVDGDELLAVTAEASQRDETVSYGFLSAARSLRQRHPRP